MVDFTPTPHPVMVAPTLDEIKALVNEVGPDEAARRLQLREDKIRAEKIDSYRHGYEPPTWKDADRLLLDSRDLLINGGNRAGKTEYAAKRVCQLLASKPEARVSCLHTTNQSSIQMQQNVIYKYLPPEFRTARKTKITNVGYTQKNGFSDNTFVLPNKSQCWFMNYAQDKKVIEGGECDLIWCDELVPVDWIDTLRYRLVTRNGALLVTFTPVTGYTPVVKEYVSGIKVQKVMKSTLLPDTINVTGTPKGTMPYIGKCHGRKASVMWFHSELNPYNDWEAMKSALKGRGAYETKIRAYGWAESLTGNQFPMFGEHNVLEPSKIPLVGTNYMVVDPAGARNWFMLWMRVDERGRKYIYREWPDETVGEWSLAGDKADGKIGIGQRNGAGRGISAYRELIRSLEGKEKMFERYIDPRAGGTQAAGRDGGTSLIDLLEDDNSNDANDTGMRFEPAAGLRLEDGISMINDWLAYDQNQPITAVNEPHLYISSACQNLIYSMKEWTGADGDKGASKDPIDCLRYLAVMSPQYYAKDAFKSTGGGSY